MKIFIFSVILLSFVVSSSVMAQGHRAYCKNVDSTASSQVCLTRHLKSAQDRLNKIYVKLGDSLEAERLAELKALQKTWLTYRDAECMWEASSPEDISLRRVNELSCMARVTEDRVDLLTIAYGDVTHPDTQRQLGSFPSWMNSVAKQYPNIYWNYGARLKGDLNCDGQDEHIMTGLQLKGEYPDIHLTVVETPAVGKAKPTLFTFPVKGEEEPAVEQGICSINVKVEIKENNLPQDSEVEDKVCQTALILTSKGCAPKVINWTGKAFNVAVEKEPTNKKDKKKN